MNFGFHLPVILFADDLPALGAVCFLICIAMGVLACIGLIVRHVFGIVRLVSRHLGLGWKKGTIINHPLLNWERTNIFIALEALLKGTAKPGKVLSLGQHKDLLSALQSNPGYRTPLEFTFSPTSLTTKTKVIVSGLYRLHTPGLPPCVAALGFDI